MREEDRNLIRSNFLMPGSSASNNNEPSAFATFHLRPLNPQNLTLAHDALGGEQTPFFTQSPQSFGNNATVLGEFRPSAPAENAHMPNKQSAQDHHSNLQSAPPHGDYS